MTVTINTDFFLNEGYQCPLQLKDGTWVALLPLIYTTAIVMGLDDTCYSKRYCFESLFDAFDQLMLLESTDNEPVGWIAKRPR